MYSTDRCMYEEGVVQVGLGVVLAAAAWFDRMFRFAMRRLRLFKVSTLAKGNGEDESKSSATDNSSSSVD